MRITVYLDEDVLTRVRRLVGRRALSQFVNEAVAEKIEAEERDVEQAMRDGYLASRLDRDTVNED